MTRCRALRTQAGGKGANVPRATRALGGEALLVGFAAGRGGRLIAELAQEEGLELEVAGRSGEARVSTVVLGDDGSVTRLYEIGPQITADDERALEELVGATGPPRPASGPWSPARRRPAPRPASTPPSLGAARSGGYRVLVDATGEQLAGALAGRPDLVKVNLAEACTAIGPPRPLRRREDAGRSSSSARAVALCREAVRRRGRRRRAHARRRRRRRPAGRRRPAASRRRPSER